MDNQMYLIIIYDTELEMDTKYFVTGREELSDLIRMLPKRYEFCHVENLGEIRNYNEFKQDIMEDNFPNNLNF